MLIRVKSGEPSVGLGLSGGGTGAALTGSACCGILPEKSTGGKLGLYRLDQWGQS